MSDEPILTTILKHIRLEDRAAAVAILSAIQSAGFDVAPIDTIRLGQAVAGCTVKHTPERVEVPR